MSDWTSGVLVMLLAGGQGERLHPLTKRHAKPAVRFGGLYRIIDFTLSNCLNSGLRRIYVLTQYHSLSLDRHLRLAWSVLHPELGEFVQAVPPSQHLVSRWYAGTADAVFQNLHLLDEERPEHVLIVSGDHVYRMDYGPLVRRHLEHGADVTIACTEVSVPEARRMGVVEADEHGHVVGFAEKPEHPVPLRHDHEAVLANMGVYVFRTPALVRALIADAKRASVHDFGHSILPHLVAERRVEAWNLAREAPADRYWQDVGTLDGYFAASMDLLADSPPFALADPGWPIRTAAGRHAPAMIRGTEGRVVRSLLAPGCSILDAEVQCSILAPDVTIAPGARVEEAILMPNVRIGRDCRVRRAIVDEGVVLPDGFALGFDETDARRFTVTPQGVVVIAEGTLLH